MLIDSLLPVWVRGVDHLGDLCDLRGHLPGELGLGNRGCPAGQVGRVAALNGVLAQLGQLQDGGLI